MIQLREARSTDAGKVGAILTEFAQEADWMPKLHTGAEDVAYAGVMIERGWVSIAMLDGEVAGFAACDAGALDALYVAAKARGKGLGSTLLQHLQGANPALTLWTFQANLRAQTFYEKHGFTEQERTNGARNDEGLPDIRFHWRREAE
ncbi:GNAT family N-acetyltransferase [Sulfitobacter sp. F26204]|uniref:GNAT family N-acetyltransferase n=1 Tax=Sulfitobacter sp. F26204 TaxID=2996014 RepID=UPI00225E64E1|nr:GNAT family N-acetyltransferase [Sulfitobacter sp. F26204]MCX7558998.1 GNAT family N-acetyltransferase [Sulfitobacter sp. F26204]